MAGQATLYDPTTGKKVVVGPGAANPQDYWKQGYKLYTGQQTPQQPSSNPFDVNSLMTQYNQGTQDLAGATRTRQAFADALKSALTNADTNTGALRKQQIALQEQQGNVENQLRDQLIKQGITDPFKRKAIQDQRYGSLGSAISGIMDKISQRGGRLEDILNTGKGAYESDLQARQIGLEGIKNALSIAEQRAAEQRQIDAQRKAAQEELDRQKQLAEFQAQLSRRFSGASSSSSRSRSTQTKPPKAPTQTQIKQAFLQDLNGAGQGMIENGLNREQVLNALMQEYGDQLDPSYISSQLYRRYSDGWENNYK